MSRVRNARANRGIEVSGLALLVLIGLVGRSVAGETGAEAALKVTPKAATLRGPESVQQLVVEGNNQRDLTHEAEYVSADPQVATVDGSGTIEARGDGQTTITVRQGKAEAQVSVTVRDYAPGPPINFTNEVVPIFTKLGCNGGGCHGKASGQNGFRLSLLGFEPELDYETLVKEARGRRLFPAAPEESLLLKKAVGHVPHGGGKRMEVGSHEYRVLTRWIASGMPMGKPDDPTVARIEVYPEDRVLDRGVARQVLVTAVYTDGSTEDVTRWAQYQSNEVEVANVEEGGQVQAGDLAGQAAIMARYQGQVAVFRATVPLGKPIDTYPDYPTTNVLDELALKQWKALGLVPSDLCSDAEFIRRASLDITGTLPTPAQVQEFVADANPQKREALVDRLLASPEYAAFFAVKWADILRNKRQGNQQYQNGTYRFHDWIKRNLAENLPYDEFVRSVLAASGTPETDPAGRLVPHAPLARCLRGRHRAGVPRHALAVREVPSPPLRGLEPGRLLWLRRLLRPRRPQAGDGLPARRAQGRGHLQFPQWSSP